MTKEAADRRRSGMIGARFVPVAIIALAGIAARLPVATAYPMAALLLFLWIVADTMMLALIAATPGRRPPGHAVVAVLAGASTTVWLGAPPPLRDALLGLPALAGAMAFAVLAHIAWASDRARAAVRDGEGRARERWLAAASSFVSPPVVRLAVAELTILHMALLRWGGPADVPPGARAFAYHRHLAPMCAALLTLSAIEVAVYHLLVGHWSRTAALVMFVLSDLGLIYLVGLIKSFRFRPVLLTASGVQVRAGFLIDRFVPFEAIAAIDTGFTGEAVRDPATLNAALLAWPNILLRLDPPQPSRSVFRHTACTAIAFRLDDPEPFLRLLAWRLGRPA